MAALVHLVKQDNTGRTNNSTTPAEVTQYTIAWADLTGAGFAAGDDVLILVTTRLAANVNSAYARFQVGRGTTYAGRTDWADSYQSVESPAAAVAQTMQYGWFKRHTLVTSENVYFSLWHSGATLVGADDFFCLVLKLGGLSANDFAYAENTLSGDAPLTYGTTGASFSTPAAGDWLLFAFAHWLVDDVTADMFLAISANGADYSEVVTEGEDLENEVAHITMAYRAALGSGQTVQARFRTDESATQDCVNTAVFGLRLDAFKNAWGAHTTNTITHSVIDTYQEFAGNGAFVTNQAGPVLALGLPIHTFNENTKQPYGRVQLANSDWDVADRNRAPARDNGAAAKQGPILNAYASIAAATHDFDFDTAEDADITPNYSCTEQIAVLFSLELAAAAYSLDATPGAFSISGASAGVLAARLMNATPGAMALTGAAAALAKGYQMLASPGGFAISGSAAGLLAAHLMNATPGAIAFTGAEAVLSRGRVMNADPGAVDIAGSAADVLAARVLLAASGAVAVTGQSADVLRAALLAASPGAVAVTGAAADVLAGRALLATPGAVDVSGSAAALLRDAVLGADPGAVAVTGSGAQVLADRVLLAEPGAVTISGFSAAILRAAILAAEVGAFEIAGAPAAILADRVMAATPGEFVIVGFDADLILTAPGAYVLDADPGTFAIAGAPAGLLAARIFAVLPGSIEIEGADAALAAARVLLASPGSVEIAGASAQLLADRLLNAGAAVVVVTGTPADILADRVMGAEPGVFLIEGADADLLRSGLAVYTMEAEPGVFVITGAPADLVRAFMAPFEARRAPIPGAVRVRIPEAARRMIAEARRKPPVS